MNTRRRVDSRVKSAKVKDFESVLEPKRRWFMSTRCQIGFYQNKESKLQDFEALLYRHSDGYPGTANGKQPGVLADIIPFLRWWKTQRGIKDLEYCAARLLQWLCDQSDVLPIRVEKTLGENTDFTGIYGHGICRCFHQDIEYFYKIYPDAVEIYAVEDNWDEFNPDGFKLIKTVKI